ncbi:hypothetical protein D9611_000701 [Ephemerocybe angulata]|uniref:MICOS complex subunit n=1 Tax=Ephemerocybe angulata TaxID=980116 RepID=A0A8H5F816_9AGAR|nr:hypothetical protein D9611_000701 [Tulosesus angulatus]
MYRAASRVPRRAVLAAASSGLVLTSLENRDKLSIYPRADPDVLLVETTSPLEEQIGAVRRQVQGVYADGYSYVQGWISKWIGIEHAVENRVKSIISPHESLTPGLLYVGIATLTGSILTRTRALPTRILLPPLFLVFSARHFLPNTTANLSSYLGNLEEVYAPSLAEKHEVAKAHSQMAWERVKEKTVDVRRKVDEGAVGWVEKVQGATGLKIKETLGLGQPQPAVVQKVEAKAPGWAERAKWKVEQKVVEAEREAVEVERKVAEALKIAEKKVEEAVKSVPEAAAADVAQEVPEEVVVVQAPAVVVVEPTVEKKEEKKEEEHKHLV